MRITRHILLAALLTGLGGVWARADDDELAARQKKRGQDNWKRALDEPHLLVENQNFLVLADKQIDEAQVRALAEHFDGFLESEKKALGIEAGKKSLWTGKLTVYLVGQKRKMNSVIRSVEKRRPTDVGQGSFYLKGEQSHIIVCAPQEKDNRPLEQEATLQLVQASFTKFAGDSNGIPEWLIQGFIDATTWQAARNPKDVARRDAERKQVLGLINHPKAPKYSTGLWNNSLKGRDQYLIRTSLVEFLAYGPNAQKFPDFLRAFKVEKGRTKTVDEALVSLDQNQTKLNRHWMMWVREGSK